MEETNVNEQIEENDNVDKDVGRIIHQDINVNINRYFDIALLLSGFIGGSIMTKLFF